MREPPRVGVTTLVTGRSTSSRAHVDEGCALEVVVVDGVEGDVDPAGMLGDRVGMLLDRGAIGRVELGDLDTSPGFGGAGCYALERLAGASDEMDRGALGGEDSGDR
jgi:hypothetical protein